MLKATTPAPAAAAPEDTRNFHDLLRSLAHDDKSDAKSDAKSSGEGGPP